MAKKEKNKEIESQNVNEETIASDLKPNPKVESIHTYESMGFSKNSDEYKAFLERIKYMEL
jgi:hypothetical protein